VTRWWILAASTSRAAKGDSEEARQDAEARRRVGLNRDVQARVEDDLPARMIDQVAGDGDAQAARLVLEKAVVVGLDPAARHGEQAHHAGPLS